MALSQKAKDALEIAMASIADSNELIDAIASSSALSSTAKAALAIALASKVEAEEMAEIVDAGSG